MDIRSASSQQTTSLHSQKHKGQKVEQKQKQKQNASSPYNNQLSEDNLIDKLRERMKSVSENDMLDADAKKTQLEDLQNQIDALEQAKHARELEALKAAEKKTEKKKDDNTDTSQDGDTATISADAKNLLEADRSLDDLQTAATTKKKMQGSATILASEISIDRSRGVNTAIKESELSDLHGHIQKTGLDIVDALHEVNETTTQTAEGDLTPEDKTIQEIVDEKKAKEDATDTDKQKTSDEKATTPDDPTAVPFDQTV